MNIEMAASIAAREQMLAQLRRHEDVLAKHLRAGIADVWLADVISRLARAITAEAPERPYPGLAYSLDVLNATETRMHGDA